LKEDVVALFADDRRIEDPLRSQILHAVGERLPVYPAPAVGLSELADGVGGRSGEPGKVLPRQMRGGCVRIAELIGCGLRLRGGGAKRHGQGLGSLEHEIGSRPEGRGVPIGRSAVQPARPQTTGALPLLVTVTVPLAPTSPSTEIESAGFCTAPVPLVPTTLSTELPPQQHAAASAIPTEL
jgi:hypothetical protein